MTNVKSQSCCPEPSTDMEEPVAEDVVPRQVATVGRPDAKSGRLWIKLCQPQTISLRQAICLSHIVHHQMSRRKSDTASARETVPPSLILPPAAE